MSGMGEREDLIGFDKKCLIRPRKTGSRNHTEPAGGRKYQDVGKGKKGAEITRRNRKKTIRNVHKKKK